MYAYLINVISSAQIFSVNIDKHTKERLRRYENKLINIFSTYNLDLFGKSVQQLVKETTHCDDIYPHIGLQRTQQE